MRRSTAIRAGLLLAAVFLWQSVAVAQNGTDPLAAGFAAPPESAKPHSWWHWVNGNVSKAGVTLDLEAMKRVGLGGAHLAQVSGDLPKGPLACDSPELVDCVKFAFQEADRLGMELCMFNCPGWSSSGGPWITPENSPKVLVYTETTAAGGGKIEKQLAQPQATLNYYRDAMVVAYPTPAVDAHIPNFNNGMTGRLAGVGDGAAADGVIPGGAATGPAGGGVDATADTLGIDPKTVVDLSKNMAAGGVLTWDAPAGNWTILRIGFTTSGSQNHPAPDGGVGLEVDKYSREAMDFHFNAFFGKYFDTMKPLAAKGKFAALIDSYEAGDQNWTQRFPEEFAKRRGYDLMAYMPAMAAGKLVGNLDLSQRFLWDARRTEADLMDAYYFGRFTELCHEHGIRAFTEPYGSYGPPVNFDEMAAGAYADMPMSEFWQGSGADTRIKVIAASIAHVNGKPIIGAESYTSRGRWTEYPFSLKAQGDYEWTQGLNRIVFHRFAMQPNPNSIGPGMTLAQYGGYFDRTNTWYEQGKSWISYITRSQFLLQQGHYAADLLYVWGEDAGLQGGDFSLSTPPQPAGYGVDSIDRQANKARVTREGGKIVLPDGASYRVMVLPTKRAMSLEMVKTIRDLVDRGMWLIVGATRPEVSQGLGNYPDADKEVSRITAELWGDMDGTAVTEHALGKGRVFAGVAQRRLCCREKLGVKPDFQWAARSGNANINFTHRRTDTADIYFIANRGQRTEDLRCTFGVAGKRPEFWDSSTGQMMPASIFDEVDGRTVVPLQLEASGSMFVVFRAPSSQPHYRSVMKDGALLAGIAPFPAAEGSALQGRGARGAARGGAAAAGAATGVGGEMPAVLPPATEPPAIELAGTERGQLLAWQNGTYALPGARWQKCHAAGDRAGGSCRNHRAMARCLCAGEH